MFYEKTSEGFILRVRVTPNTSRCTVSGIFTDSTGQVYLKVNLTSVPEKGKANSELIKYLSKKLQISKSSFNIISGETDRYKKILINSIDFSNFEEILKQLEQTNDSKNH